MRPMVVDDRGGKMGKPTIEQLKKQHLDLEIYVIGTSNVTISTMLEAGADYGTTRENPAIVNAEDPDITVGPIGIVFASSLLGETTSAITTAVGADRMFKILISINRCNHFVTRCEDAGLREYTRMVCEKADEMVKEIL